MTLKQLSGYQVTNGVNKAPITQNFKYQKKKKKKNSTNFSKIEYLLNSNSKTFKQLAGN